MRLKKAGIVTVGTAAAMVAAAPMAFATSSDGGKDGGHGPAGHGTVVDLSKTCAFEGGDAGAASEISGPSAINLVGQVPIAASNIADLANCSDFLNNNLNDNLSGNRVAIL